MVGRAPAMLELFAFIERLAPYPTTALITGESGTGKELVARAIHRLSPRSERPLVVCNCTTLAPTLIETRAVRPRARRLHRRRPRPQGSLRGRRTAAPSSSTRSASCRSPAQAKLLRVLEEREIRRVGAHRADAGRRARRRRHQPRPRRAWWPPGEFRDDLYYRLNVGTVHLPPLRERLEDLEPLVRHFIVRCNQRLGRGVTGVSPAGAGAPRAATPGRATSASWRTSSSAPWWRRPATSSCREHLPAHARACARAATAGAAPPLTLEAAERDQILRALDAAGGKRIEAARLLGLSRRTLYRKLDRHGIA